VIFHMGFNNGRWFRLTLKNGFVLTLKALANFSPGLRFGNPGLRKSIICPTLKGFERHLRPPDATLSGLRLREINAPYPRVAKAQT